MFQGAARRLIPLRTPYRLISMYAAVQKLRFTYLAAMGKFFQPFIGSCHCGGWSASLRYDKLARNYLPAPCSVALASGDMLPL